MQTLKALQNGELRGIRHLALSCDLETFPQDIFDLANTLELLDLSNNRLSTLPDDFGKLHKLKILFLSKNHFEIFPSVLANCTNLTMIGFKSNQITTILENSFPLNTRWLILTDNRLAKLPESIGDLHALQKCAFAGNQLTTLPQSMQNCTNLELLRISANTLKATPKWLFTLPKLSWFGVEGNPCSSVDLIDSFDIDALQNIEYKRITLLEKLGEGASGIISKALIDNTQAVALKCFKADVTSDGYPADEMQAAIIASKHPNLNTPFAKITHHPNNKQGLLFALIPPHFRTLANPPSFESCSRDIYVSGTQFGFIQLHRTLTDVASALYHLHKKGISHGDLYAHNTLVDNQGHAIVGDFGAATCYDVTQNDHSFERLEVRAFGCMIEELLERCCDKENYPKEFEVMESLMNDCMQPQVSKRPVFEQIQTRLKIV